MNAKHQLLTVIVTIALLGFSGAGCSDKDSSGAAANAALCAQLNQKQGQLDCSVAALQVNCAPGDSTCLNNKQTALAACSSASSTWTSVARAGCGATGSSTSSSSSTATAVGTTTPISTSTASN
jgi:hypothetical protein